MNKTSLTWFVRNILVLGGVGWGGGTDIWFGQRCAIWALKPLLTLRGLAMIFAGQENPFIIFKSKEI